MVTEFFNIKSSLYTLVKNERAKKSWTYNKFINWVNGEFDLQLKTNDSRELKVYFPNGVFSIKALNVEENNLDIEIKVTGKSRTTCNTIMKQLQEVYGQVERFQEPKNKCIKSK